MLCHATEPTVIGPVTAAVWEAVRADRSPAGVTFIGGSTDRARQRFPELQERLKIGVNSMVRRSTFTSMEALRDVNDMARRTGTLGVSISGRLDMPPPVLPLQVDAAPRRLLPDIPDEFILLDWQAVIVRGPDDSQWLTERRDIVANAVRLWGAALRRASPVTQFGTLTHRQRHVAVLMTHGLTDAAIARDLGVSHRTIAAEAAVIIRTLGARSRFEAGFVLGSGGR